MRMRWELGRWSVLCEKLERALGMLSAFCPLGPLGFDFSQHGPTTRLSRRKDCRESIYAFGSLLALQCFFLFFWFFFFFCFCFCFFFLCCCFLGPLGFNFSQHGPTTRLSRRKECRESIYAFGSRLALQCPLKNTLGIPLFACPISFFLLTIWAARR